MCLQLRWDSKLCRVLTHIDNLRVQIKIHTFTKFIFEVPRKTTQQ